MVWESAVYGQPRDIEPVVFEWADEQGIGREQIELSRISIKTYMNPSPQAGTKISVSGGLSREQISRLRRMLVPTPSPRIYYWRERHRGTS